MGDAVKCKKMLETPMEGCMGQRVRKPKAGQARREWKEETALVSSLAGVSTPGAFLSISVVDEDTKFPVWWCPKEEKTR